MSSCRVVIACAGIGALAFASGPRAFLGDLVVVASSFLAVFLLGMPLPLAMSSGGIVLAARAALRDVAATISKGQC